MDETKVRALFLLANIAIEELHDIPNQYWPDTPNYADIRAKEPWWLVKTPHGVIRIGWRKRVISINWENTGLEQLITRDDVTMDTTMVHAWSYGKAVEYLTVLGRALTRRAEKVTVST